MYTMKIGTLLSILAVTLMLAIASGSAVAQNVGDSSDYFVTYFANNIAAAPDATVRFVNDGESTVNRDGILYASIYVFNDSQELTECCSCPVTADGILSESVRNQLTTNPITGVKPPRGVIKVISSTTESDVNTGFAPNTPAPGLRGWATHIQSVANKYPYGPAAYSQTETRFADANLTSGEQGTLQLLCYYDNQLSGLPCPCTVEDYDF
jgi:hypothetical protein